MMHDSDSEGLECESRATARAFGFPSCPSVHSSSPSDTKINSMLPSLRRSQWRHLFFTTNLISFLLLLSLASSQSPGPEPDREERWLLSLRLCLPPALAPAFFPKGPWTPLLPPPSSGRFPFTSLLILSLNSSSLPLLQAEARRSPLVEFALPDLPLPLSSLASPPLPPPPLPLEAPSLLGAPLLWAEGYRGQGVRVGIFDTGLGKDATGEGVSLWDYTEGAPSDPPGAHGGHVASLLGTGQAPCRGLAPDAEGAPSWFLDALNAALSLGVNVLNLSLGGADWGDQPFLLKLRELAAHGVLIVAAAGNDGPGFASLANPADMPVVLAVGALSPRDEVASYSGRGPTLWELPQGAGRPKPDLLAPGEVWAGSGGSCSPVSGTSMAAPLVSGAVSLLLSAQPSLSPGAIRQILAESALRLPQASLLSQGAGKLNLEGALNLARSYEPHVSSFPSHLDLRDCPYLAPWCEQPLYAGQIPLLLNLTLLSGVGPRLSVLSCSYLPQDAPSARLLRVSCISPPFLWPWVGSLGLRLQVPDDASSVEGLAQGQVVLRFSQGIVLRIPVVVPVIPTPPRNRRLLWDSWHQLSYPQAYAPRDALGLRSGSPQGGPFDARHDLPQSNFRSLWLNLRAQGYFLEVLGASWTCIDASSYVALLLVDPEEPWSSEERAKLKTDVDDGLGLFVAADWWAPQLHDHPHLRFWDDNTRRWWTPVTGGANVPALNELLAPFGAALGVGALDGSLPSPFPAHFRSGAPIAQWPVGGRLGLAELVDQTAELNGRLEKVPAAFLGLLPNRSVGGGRLVVLGDSTCLDDLLDSDQHCRALLAPLLAFLTSGQVSPELSSVAPPLSSSFLSRRFPPPALEDSPLEPFSPLLRRPPNCSPTIFPQNSPLPPVEAGIIPALPAPPRGAGHFHSHPSPPSSKGRILIILGLLLSSVALVLALARRRG